MPIGLILINIRQAADFILVKSKQTSILRHDYYKTRFLVYLSNYVRNY